MDDGEIDHFPEQQTTTTSILNIRSKESTRGQSNLQALHRTATFQPLIFRPSFQHFRSSILLFPETHNFQLRDSRNSYTTFISSSFPCSIPGSSTLLSEHPLKKTHHGHHTELPFIENSNQLHQIFNFKKKG
jgi:hypothetical protein